jgi:hypothetical protein
MEFCMFDLYEVTSLPVQAEIQFVNDGMALIARLGSPSKFAYRDNPCEVVFLKEAHPGIISIL